MSRIKYLILLVAVALVTTSCGSAATKTVTQVSPGPPTPSVQAVPGHPCVAHNYYLNCLYAAPGQELLSLPSSSSSFGSQFGIDFAWGGPAASLSARGGVRFAVSYLSGSSKDWSYSQLHDYLHHRLSVGFVWETTQGRALQGCAAGRYDAQRADGLLGRYGIGHSVTIFLAVDTDTSAGAVSSYFSCAHGVLGSRTGAYGGYRVVSGLMNSGAIHRCWQTLAWSFGVWDSRCGLEQTSVSHSFSGFNVDYDRRIKNDAGLYPYNPGPAPVNHHYARFPNFRVNFGHGVRARERTTVQTWDKNTCKRPVRRIVCGTSLYHLVLLRDRLWYVAHHPLHNGHATWSLYWRGWRLQELIHRTG